MNYCEKSSLQIKSVFLNNNNNNMDPQTTSCSSKSLEERPNEEFQNLNEADENAAESENENVNSDSDEMFVNSFDEAEDDDVQLSSPSNSHNSDVDQRWYAFRGRFVGVHNDNDINNRLPLDNHQINQPQPQPPQEEEETDFLEMDFEPDTNSEIENEAKFSDYVLPNGHQHAAALNFHNHPLPPQPEFLPLKLPQTLEEPASFIRPASKNTGAKPKQLSAISRPQKPSRHVSDGDNVFKISTTLNNNFIGTSSSLSRPSTSFGASSEVYNLGASSSRVSYHDPHTNDIMKIHKSPSKSASHHHNNKHLRLHEEQNDLFLFEIEPLKPRNSVTIYTTNCDEKILIDALVSFFGIFRWKFC